MTEEIWKGPDTELISTTQDKLDEKEVKLFMQVEDWRPRAGDSATLWDRACEICGTDHPYCQDLQLALRELRDQDPEFGKYVAPALEPEPEPTEAEKLVARGIIRVPSHGNTGTLTVDPEVRRELNKLPLKELARRAAVDRHANLRETRRKQIRASEI